MSRRKLAKAVLCHSGKVGQAVCADSASLTGWKCGSAKAGERWVASRVFFAHPSHFSELGVAGYNLAHAQWLPAGPATLWSRPPPSDGPIGSGTQLLQPAGSVALRKLYRGIPAAAAPALAPFPCGLCILPLG